MFEDEYDVGLRCPITNTTMVDPVCTVDGHTYERGAITTWLKYHNTSPLTNLPLCTKILNPNHHLRSFIMFWKEHNHGVPGIKKRINQLIMSTICTNDVKEVSMLIGQLTNEVDIARRRGFGVCIRPRQVCVLYGALGGTLVKKEIAVFETHCRSAVREDLGRLTQARDISVFATQDKDTRVTILVSALIKQKKVEEALRHARQRVSVLKTELDMLVRDVCAKEYEFETANQMVMVCTKHVNHLESILPDTLLSDWLGNVTSTKKTRWNAVLYEGLDWLYGNHWKIEDKVRGALLIRFAAERGGLDEAKAASMLLCAPGLVKNCRAAFKLLRQLDAQDDTVQRLLGLCYDNGYGVEKDVDMAFVWYHKAAKQGNSHAQNDVGVYYDHHNNTKTAVVWYHKAAKQGFGAAQFNLGLCFQNGEGVVKDLVKAVEWYRQAAKQNDVDAENSLGDCYYDGDGVVQDFKKAVVWYRRAAEKGFGTAQFNLGVCFQNGEGVEKDLVKAVEWYHKAAKQDDSDAQEYLGDCYSTGDGVTKDFNKAIEWYHKAAQGRLRERERERERE